MAQANHTKRGAEELGGGVSRRDFVKGAALRRPGQRSWSRGSRWQGWTELARTKPARSLAPCSWHSSSTTPCSAASVRRGWS